jgi:hypothetical protein
MASSKYLNRQPPHFNRGIWAGHRSGLNFESVQSRVVVIGQLRLVRTEVMGKPQDNTANEELAHNLFTTFFRFAEVFSPIQH